MTTRTKLNITLFTVSTMTLLNVFSKPLHIPQEYQWLLTLGVFIPLAFLFHLIKKQKQEKLEQAVIVDPAGQPVDDTRQTVKKRLILMMVLGTLVGLCSPFWLPVTGSTLGFRGDLACGLLTAVVVCLIVGLRLRKI